MSYEPEDLIAVRALSKMKKWTPPAAGRWIPASEPPADVREVLCFDQESQIKGVGWYAPVAGRWTCIETAHAVTHYAHIHQPPTP